MYLKYYHILDDWIVTDASFKCLNNNLNNE